MKTEDKVEEYNWDTNECIDWWLNDEGYYNMSYSEFREFFKEKGVDRRKIRWSQVRSFIRDERAGR